MCRGWRYECSYAGRRPSRIIGRGTSGLRRDKGATFATEADWADLMVALPAEHTRAQAAADRLELLGEGGSCGRSSSGRARACKPHPIEGYLVQGGTDRVGAQYPHHASASREDRLCTWTWRLRLTRRRRLEARNAALRKSLLEAETAARVWRASAEHHAALKMKTDIEQHEE